MPALSLLKRSSRESPAKKLQKTKIEATAAEAVEDGDGRPGSVSPTTEKRSRRNSTRDLLHDLINRSLRVASLSTPQRGKAAGSQRDSAASTPTRSKTTPNGLRSPVDPNKPLPSPPPPGSEADLGPAAKPVLKLARIMSTLSDDDVEKLFSGAPQYFARSEGHFTGAPHPSIAYPWDEAVEIRDLTDHVQIEDEAWSCATAWPHITRDCSCGKRDWAKTPIIKKRGHFYPRCRERPNMLSMQGLEKGTIGYQAALELAVSDALQEEQWGFDTLGSKSKVIVEARQRLITTKDGLRHIEETRVLDELIKNGHRYENNNMKTSPSATKFYAELFNGILYPPTRILDQKDPYSLHVQIQALLSVLAAPNVWVDFSHVEWRIRLGQILWTTSVADDVDDGAWIDDAESDNERHEERYWLLVQILLASELLIRLDAITDGEELGTESIKRSEIHRFEKDANASVKWSLILARAWLENIEIKKTDPPPPGEEPPVAPQHTGWLATLTKRMSLSGDTAPASSQHRPKKPEPTYAMRGRYGERQVHGLTHFAQKLGWPEVDNYSARISDNCKSVTDGAPLVTPVATPMVGGDDNRRTSYFGNVVHHQSHLVQPQPQPQPHELRRQPSRRRKVAAALHPSGWLSKSYVSGLMLPGEGIYHFLMSTLLENDKAAMAKLGPMANLCGGFVYCGKSFWSTSCIVGRVLAAGKGSSECMGWISSDIVPLGLDDGWVNIEVEELREDLLYTDRRARLWGKAAIERESSVLGDADPSSVLPADFILPFENIYREKPPARIKIELKSLELLAPADSASSASGGSVVQTPFTATTLSDVSREPPEIKTCPAAITFTVAVNDEKQGKDYTYALAKDVNFVTAHPCVPSQHVKILKSPSSPTIQQIDVTGALATRSASSVHVMGHPLHKYYTYTAIHLSDLIKKQDLSLDQLLTDYSSTSHRPNHTPATHKMPKVLVVDCITGFTPGLQADEIPASPILSRDDSSSIRSLSLVLSSEPPKNDKAPADASKMHHETRRRQFGSDMEILVRAFCSQKGWNAIISRRRRGCLACAIREAGAIGWKVVLRVD